MTIPDEAGHAAHAEYHKVLGDSNRSNPMLAALTSALPFLTGVKVNVDTIVQPLEDIHAAGGLCKWTDVATAIGEVRRLLYAIEVAPSPRAQVLEEAVQFAPAMVPAKMLLEAKSIQDLLFILGGCDEENPYHDGILWVGTIPDEDGDRYGLHVYSNEYPEEGSITLATFEPDHLPVSPGASE
jgi:hypothetical protein